MNPIHRPCDEGSSGFLPGWLPKGSPSSSYRKSWLRAAHGPGVARATAAACSSLIAAVKASLSRIAIAVVLSTHRSLAGEQYYSSLIPV